MKIDTSTWKWFQLGGDDGLFDIRKGKRLTSEDQTEGNTPYIGAIDSNNGVSNYIGQEPIHEGNTISLSYNGFCWRSVLSALALLGNGRCERFVSAPGVRNTLPSNGAVCVFCSQA